MELKAFIGVMEQIAPLELAMEWDNVGLIIGPEATEIRNVLVALDCSVAVAKEAVQWGAQLVLTHHPLFFAPVKRMLPDDPQTAAAYALIRGGVGLYAAHTNLDTAPGGVNDALCEALRLCEAVPFGDGMGRVGMLEQPMPVMEFAAMAGRALHTRVTLCGPRDSMVRRVAVLGGAGGEALLEAKAVGADVLVTGETKHHEGLAAEVVGLPMVVAGHYETEKVVLQPLITRLQGLTDDVQYKLAQSDASPFVQL